MHAFVVDAEVALLRDDGRYLMTVRGEGESHAAGTLAFPGGAVEREERTDILEETVRRELAEEAGLSVGTLAYVESHTFEDDGDHCLVVVFIGRYAGGEPRISDRSEIADLRWMSPDEIVNAPITPPWIVEMIARVEERRRSLGW